MGKIYEDALAREKLRQKKEVESIMHERQTFECPKNQAFFALVDRVDMGKRDYEHLKKKIAHAPYCERFDEDCRERNRDRYSRRCFLCDKDETDNGRRLSVHHVDMNKRQGCDAHAWKLIPLCQSCHGRAHTPMWQARIEYLIPETLKHSADILNTTKEI